MAHPYELFHLWTPVEAAGRRAPEGLVRGRKDTWLSFWGPGRLAPPVLTVGTGHPVPIPMSSDRNTRYETADW